MSFNIEDYPYAGSYHTSNPFSGYPESVFEPVSSTTSNDAYSSLQSSTNDYLEDLEKQAKEAAEKILAQFELAKEQAYDDKNNMISKAQQEYFKSVNPYGTISESLAKLGFDKSGGYSASNAQSSYANYVNSQNLANTLYQDAITDLKIESINSQLENDRYYADISNELMDGLESIYDKVTQNIENASSKEEQEYQKNIASALEFVETLYNMSPKKVTKENAELKTYLERIYGIKDDDFDFIVDSMQNLLGEYDTWEGDDITSSMEEDEEGGSGFWNWWK